MSGALRTPALAVGNGFYRMNGISKNVKISMCVVVTIALSHCYPLIETGCMNIQEG